MALSSSTQMAISSPPDLTESANSARSVLHCPLGRDQLCTRDPSSSKELYQSCVGLDVANGLADQSILESPVPGAVRRSSRDSARFHVVVQGTPREVHPILRDEVYAIAREAVRNAFRHSQAHNIEADITYSGSSFQLRVRDDVNVEEGRAGHYGVPGMRERAKRIGGKLDVWTGTGAGTEIELSVPGSIAYGTSPGRSFLGLVRKKAARG
jgi:hypothetical protein